MIINISKSMKIKSLSREKWSKTALNATSGVVLGLAALSKMEPHELYGFLDLLSALRTYT